MTTALARLLMLAVCGFAALSSSAAAALGLEEERIFLFTALLLGLMLLPFLIRPTLHRPSGLLLVLTGMLAILVLLDVRRFDPLDAKVVLPLLVVLNADNLARDFTAKELSRFVWRLLSAYVAFTFLYQLVAEPAAVSRGYEGIVRYDPTGSVVMHSSLSLIHLVMVAARLTGPLSFGACVPTLALGFMSLAMVFMTGTRTALVTIVLFMLMLLATASNRVAAMRAILLGGVALGTAFAGYTLLIDGSFYLRLSGGQEDFSSGRWSSIIHWLTLMGDHPWGLGLGAVREMLADGRPALDGTALLEWPHNELVRFYIEGGPFGLLFVVLLLALLVRRALRAAALTDDPCRRATMLVIAADLVAESMFQNLFNAVYHATVLILILSLTIATSFGRCRRPAEEPVGPCDEPGHLAARVPF